MSTSLPQLLYATSKQWVDAVLADFDTFLLDHAAAEKKAAGMAMSMISHYPNRVELVQYMSELAVEEMSHFKEVIKIIYDRGLQLAPDTKDDYVVSFRKAIRQGKQEYLMDRLLIGGIIEARGAERFGLIATNLDDTHHLKRFYTAIANSEKRHFSQLIELAYLYLDNDAVDARTSELLLIEADICSALPIKAALH